MRPLPRIFFKACGTFTIGPSPLLFPKWMSEITANRGNPVAFSVCAPRPDACVEKSAGNAAPATAAIPVRCKNRRRETVAAEEEVVLVMRQGKTSVAPKGSSFCHIVGDANSLFCPRITRINTNFFD
jgi:hypothetical protein